jgi:hypothetical protein
VTSTAHLQEARKEVAQALAALEAELQSLTGKPVHVTGRWLLLLTGFALGFWWGQRLFWRNVQGGQGLGDS